MDNRIELQNKFLYLAYRPGLKKISGRDLTDQNNCPAFFTTSEKGLDKAWVIVEKSFTESTKMYDVIQLLNNIKIKTYDYCAMD